MKERMLYSQLEEMTQGIMLHQKREVINGALFAVVHMLKQVDEEYICTYHHIVIPENYNMVYHISNVIDIDSKPILVQELKEMYIKHLDKLVQQMK